MKISHIAWNLAGLSIPLIVAATTIPSLVNRIGQERFGILALAWGLIGYAGALDLGIGRALTQKVGVLIGKRDFSSISTVLATASRLTLVSGLVGSLLIVTVSFLGIGELIKNEKVGQDEIRSCMILLAIALPAQAMSATYKGLNEAFLNFKSINLLRAALGALNFGGPFLTSLYSENLTWLIGSLVVSRLGALVVYRKLAISCLKEKDGNYFYSNDIAKSLFGFGGWITASGIISPILMQADRFVIASTISASAVFVYVLPYEVVVQSLVIVGAVSSVMFPGLSRLIYENPMQWKNYFKKWLIRVALVMGSVCLLMAIMLPFVLPLWLKGNISSESIVIGQILCMGVFANSLAAMFYALLHAQGRASTTAKLHFLELPIFLIGLTMLVSMFGAKGAAYAWVGRMACDAIALAWLAKISNA